MITPDMNPWANRDAANAAGYARWHAELPTDHAKHVKNIKEDQ